MPPLLSRFRPLAVAAAAAALALVAIRVGPVAADAPPVAAAREFVMGTIVELRVYDAAGGRPGATRALEAALAEIRTVDRLMAVQRADSDVSRLNREAARGPVRVDPRVLAVLRASRRVGELTGGAFDVTVLPIVRAWGFVDGTPHVPAATPRIAGFRHVVVDTAAGTVAFSDPGVQIDLGGIAKGYALDRARAILRAEGVASAYLDLGGEIATLGTPVEGGRWRVGIRHPRRPASLLGVVEVDEAAVSTSGDAEQFVGAGARRIGHIVDPRRGAPAEGLASATVVAASATMADALSTAAVVLGVGPATRLLERLAVDGIFASLDGDERAPDVVVTPGARFARRDG
jgi:thiamine biosynthesis lipoprotein